MRRLLSTFLHILALDTKPTPPPAVPPVDLDALLDLALVMQARWEGTALSGPGHESHRLVAAALSRIFPGDVQTVERCAVVECHLSGCDECATEAQLAKADAELTDFLAARVRPDVSTPGPRTVAEADLYLAQARANRAKCLLGRMLGQGE